jgi:polyisoprenoid-binding protein YceI
VRQTFLFAAAAAALLFSPAAQAQVSKAPADVHAGAFVADPNHSKITWSVTHFGFSTYIGQFPGVMANLKLDPKALGATTLDATIDTTKLGTLNAALDTHLKSPDFLDVAKFPQATFKATSVKSTGASTAEITGDLTLHGVTKPVTLQASFVQGGTSPIDKKYTLGFQAKGVIKRSDFGVKTYAPAISDDVTLEIDAEFKAAS